MLLKKIFLLHYIQNLCQYRLCKADHASLTYLIQQRQLNHLNGRKLDHLQVELTGASQSLLYSLRTDSIGNTSMPALPVRRTSFYTVLSDQE
jgi:hypothetical protein